MRLSLRALNRATLDRQRLLAREHADVVATVRQIVGLQAQEPASPYLALWNRFDGFDPGALDEAFRSFALVKSTLMRIALHAVAADDRPTLAGAMRPTLRAAGLGDRRFLVSGLGIVDPRSRWPAGARRQMTLGQVLGRVCPVDDRAATLADLQALLDDMR